MRASDQIFFTGLYDAGTPIATTLSAVAFSLLYLRRRSALEPITAHAFTDVLAMIGSTMQAG